MALKLSYLLYLKTKEYLAGITSITLVLLYRLLGFNGTIDNAVS